MGLSILIKIRRVKNCYMLRWWTEHPHSPMHLLQSRLIPEIKIISITRYWTELNVMHIISQVCLCVGRVWRYECNTCVFDLWFSVIVNIRIMRIYWFFQLWSLLFWVNIVVHRFCYCYCHNYGDCYTLLPKQISSSKRLYEVLWACRDFDRTVRGTPFPLPIP